MNNDRRKEIQRAIDLITEAQQILTSCAEEETEYFDNMPESFQSGEKGDRAQECIDALETAAGELEDTASNLGDTTQ